MTPMNLNDLNNGAKTIIIAGENVSVQSSASVKDTLKELLRIDSFTIYVDGSEVIQASDIPATFADCTSVEVKRYVKAGAPAPMVLSDLNEEDDSFTVLIAGEEVKICSDADVKGTLKALLEEKGIDSFTIIIDGREVIASVDIPDTFAECDTVEVRRYVKAGK